jgi:hypothetical protein
VIAGWPPFLSFVSTLKQFRFARADGARLSNLADRPRSTSALKNEMTQKMDGGDELEFELTPGPPEETTDPVRIYLREMGPK